jgi:hypothetical protein
MTSKTVRKLFMEITTEFERIDAVTLEADFLQSRIDEIFDQLDRISARQDSTSIEIIEANTQLVKTNTYVLKQSLLNVKTNILDEAEAVTSKSALSDEDAPQLERLLAKLKRARQLKARLRAVLVGVLDEARELKTRADQSEPKA